MWSHLWQKIYSLVWSNFGLNKDDERIVIRDRRWENSKSLKKNRILKRYVSKSNVKFKPFDFKRVTPVPSVCSIPETNK